MILEVKFKRNFFHQTVKKMTLNIVTLMDRSLTMYPERGRGWEGEERYASTQGGEANQCPGT